MHDATWLIQHKPMSDVCAFFFSSLPRKQKHTFITPSLSEQQINHEKLTQPFNITLCHILKILASKVSVT